jgi:hypothetical protein
MNVIDRIAALTTGISFFVNEDYGRISVFLTSICGRRYITVVVERRECTP